MFEQQQKEWIISLFKSGRSLSEIAKAAAPAGEKPLDFLPVVHRIISEWMEEVRSRLG